MGEEIGAVVVASDDLDFRVGSSEGFRYIAKESGNFVIGVSSHNGVEDRTADVACTAGAPWTLADYG